MTSVSVSDEEVEEREGIYAFLEDPAERSRGHGLVIAAGYDMQTWKTCSKAGEDTGFGIAGGCGTSPERQAVSFPPA